MLRFRNPACIQVRMKQYFTSIIFVVKVQSTNLAPLKYPAIRHVQQSDIENYSVHISIERLADNRPLHCDCGSLW